MLLVRKQNLLYTCWITTLIDKGTGRDDNEYINEPIYNLFYTKFWIKKKIKFSILIQGPWACKKPYIMDVDVQRESRQSLGYTGLYLILLYNLGFFFFVFFYYFLML